MKARVSVIVVNYNSGAFLLRCIQHCLRQTVLPDEIVVVDNASEDGSLAGVRELPRVTVLQMDRNIGFAAANNRAIERCDAEFVVLLNPDAFPEPGWLAALLGAAQARPDAAAFGSRQMQAGSEGVLDGTGDRYFISGQIRRDGYQVRCTVDDLRPREIFSPCAAAAMYRMDALRASGGFDEDFFCYAEDVDLGFRLRLQGHRAWYVPDAVVWHVGSATTGGQHGDFATYHGHRNLVWVFVKNMPSALFWVLLPLHVALNVASFLWLAARGQGGIAWRAKRDALKGLVRMWAKRQSIERHRRVTVAEIWHQLDRRLLPMCGRRSSSRDTPSGP
jgi:GT2 family glycosyltransferase